DHVQHEQGPHPVEARALGELAPQHEPEAAWMLAKSYHRVGARDEARPHLLGHYLTHAGPASFRKSLVSYGTEESRGGRRMPVLEIANQSMEGLSSDARPSAVPVFGSSAIGGLARRREMMQGSRHVQLPSYRARRGHRRRVTACTDDAPRAVRRARP